MNRLTMNRRIASPTWCCCFVLCLLAQPLLAQTANNNEPPPTELPRIEPLTTAAALESFEIAPGYRIELVAAEPLVVDPVAFCFDAQGRLIVAEMRGYSERRDDHAGRVRRLTDTDGDGRMDQAEVLMEGLAWPTAIACVEGGILVAAAPDVIFIPDSSSTLQAPAGDASLESPGSARSKDTAQVWARGFGTSNVQGLINSLRWGLDLRLHGATSSAAGTIVGLGHGEPYELGRRDFAIDFLTGQLSAVDGGGQHGMMIDPWGDKYVCSNSDHLQEVLIVPTREYRAARLSSVPPLRRSIAIDGPQADVFRASPVEPWRILRTYMRVSGKAQGPIEGGGRAAGYFTGATGVYVYDGDQWQIGSDESSELALVCDVGSNLVHRKRLDDEGLWKSGQRVDQETEFIRSRDIWFRPVQLGTGPDGALYIADMYREVIEHPLSLPPLIKNQVDLNSGNDRGRIWRVVAEDKPLRRKTPNLDSMSVLELIRTLDNTNAWQRRTAGRLLLEAVRRDEVLSSNSITALREVASRGEVPAGRLQALALLVRLQQAATVQSILDIETLRSALADEHARIRQRAIEWAAELPQVSHAVPSEQWLALSNDRSIFVRFQLAYDAKQLLPDDAQRAVALANVAKRDPNDPWIRWAAEGSLHTAALPLATSIAVDGIEGLRNPQPWLSLSLSQAMLAGQSDELLKLLEQLREHRSQTELVAALSTAVNGVPATDAQRPLAAWLAPRVAEQAARLLAADSVPIEELAVQLRLVRWTDELLGNTDTSVSLLSDMLTSTREGQLQIMAIEHLLRNSAHDLQIVIERLPSLTPIVQEAALTKVGETREGLNALVAAINSGALDYNEVPQSVRQRMVQFVNFTPKSGELARVGDGFTPELYESYRQALAGEVDREAGLAVFKRLCATCHRVSDVGKQVGPDLKSVASKAEDQILLSIMDPNREVDPRYRLVQVETMDGRLIAGVLETETDSHLLIVDSQGNQHQIARVDIEQLRTRPQSLMPEGLVREISLEEMRHLIGILKEQS